MLKTCINMSYNLSDDTDFSEETLKLQNNVLDQNLLYILT